MKKFKNRESELFIEAFDREAQKRGLSLAKFSALAGFKAPQNVAQIRSGKNSVQMHDLKRFCDQFGYSFNSFFEGGPVQKEESLVEEAVPAYNIHTIESRVKEIELQFETVLKGQESIKQIISSTTDFIDVQTNHIVNLRNLVGV